mmetsp:Transcript_4513/g.8197  ORF Transcript_4513/g.8197 Transcript_4513/m.8197 type:complete len:80 (-) Transcript_4513:172-411(-)
MLRRMVFTSNELKYATGVVRLSLLDQFAKVLESEEGQAILRCHMRPKDRLGKGFVDFMGFIFWPLTLCSPTACGLLREP